MKQIFPKEIIKNTVEVHRFKHTVTSKLIYSILMLTIIGVISALPFIRIDVYSSAYGLIKSEKERNQIFSLHPGKIKIINIKENQLVHRGDTLLIVDNSIVKEKIDQLSDQLKETKKFIQDLYYLSTNKKIFLDSLQSILYQKEHQQYAQKLFALQIRLAKTRKNLDRQKKLFKKNVISRVTYETNKYDFDLAFSELVHFRKQQSNLWQSKLILERNKVRDIENNIFTLEKEQSAYFITASIKGFIQNLIGIEVGNFITSGSIFAEISPETNLIVECYLKPSEIGQMRKDATVKFQIDAFNHNQWGMASGKVISINNDISYVNEQPRFKVICSIDQNKMQLKNGFEGTLKKGMSINAQFLIANRSLFNLLFDKVEHWFDPSQG